MKTFFLYILLILNTGFCISARKPTSKKFKTDSILHIISSLPEESRLEHYLKLAYYLKDTLPYQGIEYGNKALAIAEKASNTEKTGEAFVLIASSYYFLSDFVKAQTFFAKATSKFEDTGNREKAMEAHYNNAIMHIVMDNYKKALEPLQKSYELAKLLKNQHVVIRISKELAELFCGLGNYKNSIEYYRRHFQMRDSADNVVISSKVQLLETQIEREKYEKIQKHKALEKAKLKEKELSSTLEEKKIVVRKQEKMLDTKENEIKVKDISLVEKEKKVATQKKWINIFIIGLIALVAYALLLFLMYKNKKKTNKILSAQYEEIRQQKEEILAQRDEILSQRDEIISQRDEIAASRDLVMDQKKHIEGMLHEVNQSIDYAQRIQATVLPEESFLDEHFDSHFILYKPKNKVSGDFYWCAHVEGQIIVAVADCTGHGVPGAFMSMLGTSFLREIVQKEYITDPAVILRKLRKEIIKALKQKGTSGEQNTPASLSVKDGMDIALVSINKKSKLMHYAGANSSLLFIRHAEIVENLKVALHELKADKMPIGIFDQMVNFTNHEIQMQSGDMIYIFSDGYADQFGGSNTKKYLSKNFRKLITEISTKSMLEQKVILDVTIENWKTGFDVHCEQTDDITVLGIKI